MNAEYYIEMRHITLYLVPFFLLSACLSSNSEPLPIDKEKLEAVMLDVHVAESAMAHLQGGTKKDSLANRYYDQIAEIHQIDRETLDTCLAILQRNPELTMEIYEKMAEKMEKEKLKK